MWVCERNHVFLQMKYSDGHIYECPYDAALAILIRAFMNAIDVLR